MELALPLGSIQPNGGLSRKIGWLWHIALISQSNVGGQIGKLLFTQNVQWVKSIIITNNAYTRGATQIQD